MNSYEAVIFDLDNTLYSELEYFSDVFYHFELTKPYVDKIRKLFCDGLRAKSNDIFGDVLRYFNVYSENSQEELFRLYKTCVSTISLDKDTKDAFEKISMIGFKIGVLTNGVVEAQKNKVRCLGLSDFVDTICYARECGYEKPDIKAYEFVCKKLDVDMTRCIFIGDNVINDVKGALNAGMRTMHLIKYTREIDTIIGVECIKTLSDVSKSICP